jgi:menaquinone-9 beta-reductase
VGISVPITAGAAISIAGAGPAGSCAALAALAEGARVRLFEKSRFPRHKVCGEFLSPELRPALESLQVWPEFLRASPALIRSVILRFGRSEKRWRLPEPAFGLSRHRLDKLLLECAIARGAEFIQEPFPLTDDPAILAYGRRPVSTEVDRFFGFKAHFSGPAADAVELFVGRSAYAGVSPVEGGATNVCGLARESALAAHGFDIDRWLAGWPSLNERLSGRSRSMEWLKTGPLVFSRRLRPEKEASVYRTGDALGFIDPFTGSGILSAVLTGQLAGIAAARRIPSAEYIRNCSKVLRRQYRFSSLVRFLIASGVAGKAARFFPGNLLFSLTRPKLVPK